MRKVLVITSCTGEKKYHPENQLVQADFQNKEKLQKRESELADFACKAAEMYTGMQHLRLMEGINAIRSKLGNDAVDLFIVSAGYGLLHESSQIVPYEVTFNSMSASEIVTWSETLGIHNALNQVISKYDLVFFLLGDKYLRAVNLPLEGVRKGQQILVFASGTSKKMVPLASPYNFIEVGQEDAKSFRYGLVGLKGYLFKLLSKEIADSAGVLFDQIYENPALVMETLSKYRKKEETVLEQLNLFGGSDPMNQKKGNAKKMAKKRPVDFYIPRSEWAPNYTGHLKYFIPEWDDRVNPDYDFISDTLPEGRDTYIDDVYAHEIYDQPNYDGILVSKIIVESNKKKKAIIEQMGIHDFLRFDKSRPVMGDCGAFDYVNEYEPPYETEEILDYYQRLGFNIGVSIDHLIVGEYASDPEERMRRYNLTRANAAAFIEQYNVGNYTFLPSGIAQGWDPKSYRNAVGELIEMGYKHISLGGLVRTTTKDIIEILDEIKPLLRDYNQVHLFGIARPDALDAFAQRGVTAMDSASHLRRAWLGTGSNYFCEDGKKYAAIRIPPVDGHGIRVKKMVAEGRGTIEQFRELEQNALSSLRGYDAGLVSLEDALSAVLEYDQFIGDDRDVHKTLYREVLEDKPWQKCTCKICREIGIETIIFRGNNRNRRRGFHNTYVFYKQLKTLYPDD